MQAEQLRPRQPKRKHKQGKTKTTTCEAEKIQPEV